MRKSLMCGLLGCALALTCAGLAGCAEANATDVNAEVPEGAAPLMPVSHEGRYTCHGQAVSEVEELTW